MNAVKLIAPLDRNGNPRRLWVIRGASGAFLVIDEGYSGLARVREVCGKAGFVDADQVNDALLEAFTVNVPAYEYWRWKKEETRL